MQHYSLLAYNLDIDINKSIKKLSVPLMMCARARPSSLIIQSYHLLTPLLFLFASRFLVGAHVTVEKLLTSLPYIMRWWVVIRALKTTTQLELAVRSNNVSARWGMFTFTSLVQWIRSGGKRLREECPKIKPKVKPKMIIFR